MDTLGGPALGARLLTACQDLRIRLWDVAAEQELAAWAGHRGGYIHFGGMDRGGGRVLSSDFSGQVRLWDTEEGESLFGAELTPPIYPDRTAAQDHEVRMVAHKGRHGLLWCA
jgi:hypothetical protein